MHPFADERDCNLDVIDQDMYVVSMVPLVVSSDSRCVKDENHSCCVKWKFTVKNVSMSRDFNNATPSRIVRILNNNSL